MNYLTLHKGVSSSSTYSPGPNDALSIAILTHDIKEVHKAAGRGALAGKESLTLACQTNNARIVKFVVGEGALPDDNTMDAALKTNNQEIISLISPLCSRINAAALPVMASDALTDACRSGNEASVRLALANGAMPDKFTYPIALMNKIDCAINHQPIKHSAFDVAEMLKVQWHTDMNFYTPVLIFLITRKGFVFPPIYPYRFELARAMVDSTAELQQLAINSKLITHSDFYKFIEIKKLKEEKDWIQENVLSAKGLTQFPSLDSGSGKMYFERHLQIKGILNEFYSKTNSDKFNTQLYPK